jgi:DNA-binding MarR family transcriptional regulator
MSTPQTVAARVPLSERTSLLAHKVGCLLLKDVEDRLAPLELSSRAYFVLDGIDRDIPPSQQDLARLLSIDPNTMVTVIDELEQLGLVTRSRNAGDRRRYDLHLTPAGTAVLTRAHSALDVTERQFFAPLSAEQLQDLHALLQALLNAR